jgi:hypothetical protein
MYCDLRDIDADLLTVSAHKIPRSFILRPTLKGLALRKPAGGVTQTDHERADALFAELNRRAAAGS